MPYRRMPNGEYVDVPDDISPEALARIEAQFKAEAKPAATRVERRAQGQPRKQAAPERETADQETQRKVQEFRKRQEDRPWYLKPYFGMADSGPLSMAGSGFLANFDDEISGLVGGGIRAAKGVFTGDEDDTFSRGYQVTRDSARAEKSRIRQDNPVSATVAEIGGALANPLGTGARVLSGAGKVLGSGRAGSALTNAGARVANAGPITTGALVGMNQGALNAAGSSENMDNIVGDTATGAISGAILGGGLGALGQGIGKGVQTLRDRKPENARRVALNEVAEMLGKAGTTPTRAESTLSRSNATGNDMMVMDLAPSLANTAGKLSRNTDLRTSNELVRRGSDRMSGRAARVEQKIDETADLPQGTDALTFDDFLKAQRKGIGSTLYAKGGALDEPIKNTDEIERFLVESPDVSKLLDDAYTMAMRMGDDLQTLQSSSQGGLTLIPSMRVFDRLKREFDKRIGMAIRAGDNTMAEGLSNQLGTLKTLVSKANPQWTPVLATMRDAFQKEAALKTGQSIWSKVRKQPRIAMREVRGLTGDYKDNARLGVVDKFIEDVVSSDRPMSVVSAVTKNKHQRELMEWAFGDARKFNQFRRWVDREFKSTVSDDAIRKVGTATGGNGAGIGDEAMLAREGVAGGAFGGMPGIIANLSRRISSMKPSNTIDSQEEIARILMSDGKGMADEMKAVAKYMAQRAKSDKSRARWLGKGAQQPFTTEIGGE